ncbi:MAG: hypothetical protein FJ313_07835, partial [Gemmatimonadetes bacterium]|nr:hypothetical protein [Gemmatimonadota bacterium]
GSVTSIMVAQKLSEMAGRTVDRRNVRFREPVRQTGEFSVPVRLQENVEVEIKLVVRAAGAPAAPKAQEGPQAAPKTPDAGPETPTQAPDEAQGHGP